MKWQLFGKKKQRHDVEKLINTDVEKMMKTINTIHSKSENIHDSNESAMMLERYFTQHVRRLEMLRQNIEVLLAQIADGNAYTENVRKILEIESWLVDKFDDPTIPKDKRHYLWKECGENSELTDRTREMAAIATKLNILKPIIIR